MKPSEESLNIEPVTAPAPVSPGTRLAQARSQRGMSMDQVSRETNLSPRYVQALEADDYDALPGAAFIRGYLRRYAQLVQLPADELVAGFDAAWQARTPAAAVAGLAAASPVTRGPVKVTGLGQAGKDLLGQGAARISVAGILSWGSLALLLLLLLGTLFWNGSADSTDIDTSDPMTLDMETAVEAPVEPTPAPVPVVTEPVTPDAAATAALPTDAAAVPAPAAAPIAGVAPAAPAPTATPVATVPAATTPAIAPRTPAPAGAAVIPVAPATTPAASAPATTVPVISRPLTPGVQPAPAVKPATQTVPVTTLPAQPVRPATAAAPATVVPTGPAPVTSAEPRIDSLSFNFSGKSWISVRDATGQELVYGLKNPGQAVTVTGQAPFSINIGNVNVTTMSRNGKPVNLKPYTRGEIASFRLAR